VAVAAATVAVVETVAMVEGEAAAVVMEVVVEGKAAAVGAKGMVETVEEKGEVLADGEVRLC